MGSLGKLSTQFEGVKKAQLEPHFCIRTVEASGSGDSTIYLDESYVPEPLEDTIHTAICSHLEACGGSTHLDELLSEFVGLTKLQVEQQQYLRVRDSPDGAIVSLASKESEDEVRPRGMTPAEFAKRKKNAEKKEKKAKKSSIPAPPLNADEVERLRTYLLEQGGSINLGKLSS